MGKIPYFIKTLGELRKFSQGGTRNEFAVYITEFEDGTCSQRNPASDRSEGNHLSQLRGDLGICSG
jgi:hypothetical protein